MCAMDFYSWVSQYHTVCNMVTHWNELTVEWAWCELGAIFMVHRIAGYIERSKSVFSYEVPDQFRFCLRRQLSALQFITSQDIRVFLNICLISIFFNLKIIKTSLCVYVSINKSLILTHLQQTVNHMRSQQLAKDSDPINSW